MIEFYLFDFHVNTRYRSSPFPWTNIQKKSADAIDSKSTFSKVEGRGKY